MNERDSSPFIQHTDEFLDVIGSEPKRQVVIETDAHEGPVYIAEEQALYFTTVPRSVSVPLAGFQRVAIKRLDLSDPTFPLPDSALRTVREPSNMANGMTADLEGRLVVCEQGTLSDPARVSRLNLLDGGVTTVTDQWRGLRYNSPNDVVVKSDRTIWFTDPSYGALQGFKPAPMVGDYVYRHDPETGETTVVADSFNKPNGLAFSPDESILYINDSGAIQGPGSYDVKLPHHIRAFDVVDGRNLAHDRLFAVVTPGIPDGLKTDVDGRVYSSSASGVQVFSPTGRLLGEILAPGVANFTFGGSTHQTLFILADTVIWAVELDVAGSTRPAA